MAEVEEPGRRDPAERDASDDEDGKAAAAEVPIAKRAEDEAEVEVRRVKEGEAEAGEGVLTETPKVEPE